MRRVIVESPYAAPTEAERERNVAYARAAMADCLRRGEAPFASHLLYTQPGVLDDADPEQRRLGMQAGLAWHPGADAVVVYKDLGISSGMNAGASRARALGVPVEHRTIPGWENAIAVPLREDAPPQPRPAPTTRAAAQPGAARPAKAAPAAKGAVRGRR